MGTAFDTGVAPPGSDAAIDVEPQGVPDAAPPLRHPDAAPEHQLAWTGPELIENFPHLAYAARVLIDGAGNATVVWRQNDDSPHAEGVGANRFDPQTATWGQARFIDDGKHRTTCPSLAVDGRGNVVAVWEQERTFGWPHDVHAARFEVEAGVWRAPEIVAQSESEGMLCPRVGLDDAGNGCAVWLESRSKSGHSVHQSLFTNGGWRSSSKLLDELSGNPGYPQLAVEPGGIVTAMWAEIDGRHTGLYLRTIFPERGPSIPDVALSPAPCYAPALAVDPWGGTAALSWIEPGGQSVRLHVAYLGQPDGVWQEEALPGTIPATSITPTVAVGNRSAVLVWRQSGDDVEIMASRRGADGAWQAPRRIGHQAGAYAVPSAGLDGRGNIIAAWQDNGDPPRVVAAGYDAASDAWSEPVPLDDGSGPAESPGVAINRSGRAVVVWEQRQGTGGHLWANRWE